MSWSTRRRLLLLASLVVLLVGGARSAGGARAAPEARLDGGEVVQRRGSGCHATAVVERIITTKEAAEMLMARLPAGPSPRGPGH
ncbi:hypothetical protein SETIT_6G230600v2 [Setaria italica]|uniref:Uncharacterized protein n=1 Tax=Setaria italica TaxID=4555 RepID=K3YM69_SETIT|nr:hypothetical protein SETIT_6G230600v2 [Setaria italica]